MTAIRSIGAAATLSVLAVALLAACSECKSNSDCPSGERCVQGSCVSTSIPDTTIDTEIDSIDAPDVDPDQPDTSPDSTIDPVDVDVPDDGADTEGDVLTSCTTAADCDDGNVCTTDICHEIGLVCIYEYNNGYICDDDLSCNGIASCQMGECAPGAPVECIDPNPCVTGVCDEGTMDCAWSALSDHSFCDNGFFCDGSDECLEGVCTPTYDEICNDSSPCTEDLCDWDLNACVHDPVTLETDAIGCGDTTLQLLTGIDDRVNSYVCGGTTHPGHTAETIYEITVPTASTLQATIQKDPEDPTTFEMYLLDDVCDPTSCAAAGRETLTLAGVSGTVYIVVERDTIGAAYLNVECL